MQLTQMHPIYIIKNDKLDTIYAKDAKVGDYVYYSNGNTHKIIYVEHEPISDPVYNLSVKDNNSHNFQSFYKLTVNV